MNDNPTPEEIEAFEKELPQPPKEGTWWPTTIGLALLGLVTFWEWAWWKKVRDKLTLALLLMATASAFAQPFSGPIPLSLASATNTNPPIKNFVLQQTAETLFSAHNNTGALSFTPVHAGDALIVYATQFNGVSPITVSDGVNTYVQQQQLFSSSPAQCGITLATCLSCSNATVTIQALGQAEPMTLCVFEYSGITAFETSGNSGTSQSTSPATMNLTGTSTDGFFIAWGNQTSATITSLVLTPGTVNGNQTSIDANQAAASWDFLNSSIGFNPGTYTITYTGAAAGTYLVGIPFK